MPRVCPGLFFLASLYSSAFAIGRQATDAVGATGVDQQNAAPRVAPEEPRANVLKTICASELGQGNFARVDVFRNASGAVRVLALRPDINRFTHAPHTYYGPDGTSLLTVPERPVTPEQRKTDAVLRKQDELLLGLKESGAKFCSENR